MTRSKKNKRLNVENLETRNLLAAVSWDGEAGDALWTSAANWSTNRVPAAGDDVTISNDDGEIILNNHQTVGNLMNHGSIWIQGRHGVWRDASLTVATKVENHGTIRLESIESDWDSTITIDENGEFINEASGTIEINEGSKGSRNIQGKLVNRGLIDVDDELKVKSRTFIGDYLLDGGLHKGELFFDNATIGMTHRSSGPVTINIMAQSTVVTDIPNHVTFLVQGRDEIWSDATLNVDQQINNHGKIILDSIDSDWDATISVTDGGELINATSGVIEIKPGAAGARNILGNLKNEGTMRVSTDATIGSPESQNRNRGVIAIEGGAKLSIAGESFANAPGGYIGGNGDIDLTNVQTFIKDSIETWLDLDLPAVTNVSIFQSLIVTEFLSVEGMAEQSVTDIKNYLIVASGADGTFQDGNETDLRDRVQNIFYDDDIETAYFLFEGELPSESIKVTFMGSKLHDMNNNPIRSDGLDSVVIRDLNFSVSAPPDRFEPNSTPDEATILEADTNSVGGLTIHHGDDSDWFRWKAPNDGTMVTKVNSDKRFGDIDFSVYDANADLIASSLSFEDDERIAFPVEGGDEFLIQTRGFLRQVIPYYEISFEIIDDDDGDGIPDAWEKFGFDFDQDGEADYTLKDADSTRKDLFIEVDAMMGRGPIALEEPIPSVVEAGLATGTIIDRVIDVFLKRGIWLHVDIDETDLPLQPFDEIADFSDVRFGTDKTEGRFGTSAERQDENWEAIREAKSSVVRYSLFGDELGEASGIAANPGVDFAITLGRLETVGGTADQQAGAFMHELGHTLGLKHGGGDFINYKPNYFSVMNYHWQFPNEKDVGWELRFSDGDNLSLDENGLDENLGIGFRKHPEFAENKIRVGDLPVRVESFIGPIDFNRNNAIDDELVAADINRADRNGDRTIDQRDGHSPGQILNDHDDWGNLRFVYTTPINLRKFGDGFSSFSHQVEHGDSEALKEDRLSFVDELFGGDDQDSAVDIDDRLNPNNETEIQNASIHEPEDEDWFSFTPLLTGEIVNLVVHVANVAIGQIFAFAVLDSDGNEIEKIQTNTESLSEFPKIHAQAGSTIYFRAYSDGFFEPIRYDVAVGFHPDSRDSQNMDRVCDHIRDGNGVFNSDPLDTTVAERFEKFVTQELQVEYGDWNLDGVFNSGDLVHVFQSGEYEDDLPNNSTWDDGDFNCDREFTTTDLVIVFSPGRYSTAARTLFLADDFAARRLADAPNDPRNQGRDDVDAPHNNGMAIANAFGQIHRRAELVLEDSPQIHRDDRLLRDAVFANYHTRELGGDLNS